MKSKSWKLWIALALICGVIVSLEVFDLHPEFGVGKFHSVWVGIRHMEFKSGTTAVPARGGKKVIRKDYCLGPVEVAIER